MLRKGLAVAVILLFIGVALAPSINATDKKEINDNVAEPLDIGRGTIRGWILFPHHCGDNFTFFALRCHYITINGTIRKTGTITLRWITLRSTMIGGSNWVGPFNMLHYIFGMTFKGRIDW